VVYLTDQNDYYINLDGSDGPILRKERLVEDFEV